MTWTLEQIAEIDAAGAEGDRLMGMGCFLTAADEYRRAAHLSRLAYGQDWCGGEWLLEAERAERAYRDELRALDPTPEYF